MWSGMRPKGDFSLLVLVPVVSAVMYVTDVPVVAGSHLTPRVGDRMAEVIRSPRIRQDLPAGWAIQGVSLKGDRVTLTMEGTGGDEALLELRSPGTVGQGQGRWFSFHVSAEGRPFAVTAGLLRLAGHLDDAFPESPWVGGKQADDPPRVRAARNDADRHMQFLALTLVGGEFLAIVAFLFVAAFYLSRHPVPRR